MVVLYVPHITPARKFCNTSQEGKISSAHKREFQFRKNSGILKLMVFQLRAKLQHSRNQLSNLKPGLTEIFYYIKMLLQFQISNSLCSF